MKKTGKMSRSAPQGLKRHKTLRKETTTCSTFPRLRKIARRGGVLRISSGALSYKQTTGDAFINYIHTLAMEFAAIEGVKTVKERHLKAVLKCHGLRVSDASGADY